MTRIAGRVPAVTCMARADWLRSAVHRIQVERGGLEHVETRHVLPLVATGSFGYLLKDRVLRVDDFLAALVRVAGGGTALDPAIVQALVAPARSDDPIRDLSAREREVLELAAEGKSNTSISRQLVISERTVETHMRAIFRKLNIDEDEGSHRRVLAVLAHLTHQDRVTSP